MSLNHESLSQKYSWFWGGGREKATDHNVSLGGKQIIVEIFLSDFQEFETFILFGLLIVLMPRAVCLF